ncbi:alpha/beta fold hydrolase [Sneathiella litorea]|uniref:AMP-binding protein n=1 Tax=Sneathiella litorea TaxID=2606216 RepID=A0A6L8W9B7_9PROT|nr:alpha/beta fold hydrolase [Sneathiella litorea]MZR31685.1 AMP-binding protein [Sneathiella litorea]
MDTFRTFNDVISFWADKSPKAAVLLGPDQIPLDYQSLQKLVTDFGKELAGSGFGRNDRIAVIHSGGAEMAASLIGVCCNATVAPFNPAMSAGEFYLHFQDKKIKALAIEKDLPSQAREAAEKLGIAIIDIIQADPACAGKVRLASENARQSGIVPEAVQADDVLVVFTTSGTTSYGKIVPLPHRIALPRVKNMGQMLNFTSQDCILNIMPLFHTGGFAAGMLTTIFSGGSFFPVKNNDVDMLFHCLRSSKPTVIAGGYTVFHSIERKAQDYPEIVQAAKSSLRMLRTGTGHLDQKIAESLESIFETPVVEAYGSAETSFMACTGLPPAPRKTGSVGQPDRNRVFVVDKNGDPVPVFERGEIVVPRETAFEGYENNPAANREAFSERWYHTGDEGYLDEDGFLFITGRIKEMINRGGIKIIPTEVDQAAMKHDAIREAVSFPLPHKTLGEDIALCVVVESGKSISEGDLKNFLKNHLIPNKIPSRIVFVDEIPKGPTGKAQRRKLNQQLQVLTQDTADSASLRKDEQLTADTLKMQNIWQEVLGTSDIGLDDNFFALGGDSLQAVDLFLRIEKVLGRRLPRDILFEAGTIREMARLIEEGLSSSCVVPIQPKGNRPPLFFIHPIGGEVLGYRELARHLNDDQPFYGIQQFQSNENTSRYSSLDDMADYYLDEIRQVQPKGPYYLGGHSFGGLVAFLLAQKFSALGEETALLALLDTYLPSRKRYVSPAQWMSLHYKIWADLPLLEKPGYIFERFRNISIGLKKLIKLKFMAVSNRDPSISKTSPADVISYQDINALNVRKFRPTPYVGNAILFRTELPVSLHPDVHNEWQNLIEGRLEICDIPGGHVQIMEEPNVSLLAAKLTYFLNKVQREKPSA